MLVFDRYEWAIATAAATLLWYVLLALQTKRLADIGSPRSEDLSLTAFFVGPNGWFLRTLFWLFGLQFLRERDWVLAAISTSALATYVAAVGLILGPAFRWVVIVD